MNATYSGWRGSIMVALNQLLCWDQYFSVGGALRHVEFNPTPGTLNCASFPASVSTAPVQAMEISLYPAYNVISKMIFADPEMRQDVMCIGGTSQWPATIFRGIDQWGERYGYLLVDPIGGAIGAFSHQDGISTGGQSRTPICKLPNIEHTEQSFPLLFLYRKEVPDSGGPGRWRGGLSAESCFIPHNTDTVVQDTLSSGNAIPTSTGMMGGYPGTTNIYRFVRNSDILERLARRDMVEDIGEVQGEIVTLGLRQENFEQHPADVYAVVWTAAGGFGDPMEREPEHVLEDWLNGAVTLSSARDIYGVVLDEGTRTLDRAATAALRAKVRQRPRRQQAQAAEARGAGGAGPHRQSRRPERGGRRAPGLPEMRRRSRADAGQLQGSLRRHGAAGVACRAARRRPAPLHRRRARVPPVLLPRLRRPHRERDRGRQGPGAARYRGRGGKRRPARRGGMISGGCAAGARRSLRRAAPPTLGARRLRGGPGNARSRRRRR